jgi:ferredoxin
LNPDDEPRECHGCDACIPAGYRGRRGGTPENLCNGTGRLGVEGKGPDVEIHHNARLGLFAWRFVGESEWRKASDGIIDAFPTESAALEAARAAHREARCAYCGEPRGRCKWDPDDVPAHDFRES